MVAIIAKDITSRIVSPSTHTIDTLGVAIFGKYCEFILSTVMLTIALGEGVVSRIDNDFIIFPTVQICYGDFIRELFSL